MRKILWCLATLLSLSVAGEVDLQKLIDVAAATGGGVVTVPEGRHVTKGIYLRSNVELHLKKGAVLLASALTNDYRRIELPYSEGAWMAVVMSVGETNVAVTGEGEINGNGLAFPQPLSQGGNQEGTRPRGLFFADCSDVRLSGFTLRDSACWGVVFKCCDGVVARNVTIDSHANSNNDGFDVEARNVLIEECDVDSGDDAFCIKSNNPYFTVENVMVRRCVGRSHCNVFKIGTASHGTMRNIAFEHCRAEAPRRDCANTKPGFEGKRFHAGRERPGCPNGTSVTAIAIENVDGGRVEDVRYEDIEFEGSRTPIFVRAGRRTGRPCGTPPGNQYVFRNIVLKNIRGAGTDPVASSVTGVDGCRIENVVFENVMVVCAGAGEERSKQALLEPVPNRDGGYPDPRMFLPCILPAYGLYVDKVDGISLKNVCFSLKDGSVDLRKEIAYGASVVRVRFHDVDYGVEKNAHGIRAVRLGKVGYDYQLTLQDPSGNWPFPITKAKQLANGELCITVPWTERRATVDVMFMERGEKRCLRGVVKADELCEFIGCEADPNPQPKEPPGRSAGRLSRSSLLRWSSACGPLNVRRT